MTTGTMMIMRTMMTINKTSDQSDAVMRGHGMTLKEQSKGLVT